jgi:hypothetical protein
VVAAVLESVTPALRKNIVETGRYAVEQYRALQKQLPEAIEHVEGTGLLYSVQLDAAHLPVVADYGIEMSLRRAGINVIHGGRNALRFTPNLTVTKAEIDMQVAHVRDILKHALALEANLRPLDDRNQRTLATEKTVNDSTACVFKLDGHLFDTGFLGSLLDLAERRSVRALVQNIQVGRNREETSVAVLQVFAPDQAVVKQLLSEVGSQCANRKVQFDLLSDSYQASKL